MATSGLSPEIPSWDVARPGRDQGIWGAEQWGLLVAATAVVRAKVQADLWVDNLGIVLQAMRLLSAAAAGGTQAAVAALPRNMAGAWHTFAQMAERLHALDFQVRWVPSHDKSPGWTPPAPFNAALIRALNAGADAAATRQLNKELSDPAWVAAGVGRAVINAWTERALDRLNSGLFRMRKAAGLHDFRPGALAPRPADSSAAAAPAGENQGGG